MPTIGPKTPARIVKMIDTATNEAYMQLNQYRLMEEIGQGSYGIVKLAYNEQDRNLYAMKVLDKREIAILKKLAHPNVVKLIEVLDDPDDCYLFMVFEYVERRSLLELPTNHPLDEDTAWKYFRDTVKGLEYLHHQKIVHRDIKPSNLLLSETNCVKIADFGVSCEFEGIDAFLTGTAGSPAFMGPEALTPQRTMFVEESSQFYSGRSQDIWSLGITLYALVYGHVPFWDHYVIALHRKIKNDQISFPEVPRISSALEDLIVLMLKKDPGHRILLQEIKKHKWITKNGLYPMPSEEENCHLVTVTEEEIKNSLRVIPRLDTLILIKSMGHRKSFSNPFRASSAATSLRLRRKSASVKNSTYATAFSADVDMSDIKSALPDRPPSEQSGDIALGSPGAHNFHAPC